MRFIQSPSWDAYFNMALEEHLFTHPPDGEDCLVLWRNGNAVVVGRYQTTEEEIDAGNVRRLGTAVVRRLSGGGAMYQDLGNVNYTFLVGRGEAEGLDFGRFTSAIVEALRELGVDAEASGRNDVTAGGRKISGSAQFSKGDRLLHHGTLLFDSDLTAMGAALRVPAHKIESKGVKSVRSRVVNIRTLLQKDMDVGEFMAFMRERLSRRFALTPYELSEADRAETERLAAEKYARWDWNFGESPPYTVRKEGRFSFGSLSAFMDIGDGIIRDIDLRGDFFALAEPDVFLGALRGLPLRREAIEKALHTLDPGGFVYGLTTEALVALLTG